MLVSLAPEASLELMDEAAEGQAFKAHHEENSSPSAAPTPLAVDSNSLQQPVAESALTAEPPSILEAGTGENEGAAASSLRTGEAGKASQLASGPTSAARATLLEQIARCLQPDLRPSLHLSQLLLQIGPDGNLTAPPVVQSILPRHSADDTLAADRIVQAALLCGPYSGDGVTNQVISIVPDFSAIQPRVVAGGSSDVSLGAARGAP